MITHYEVITLLLGIVTTLLIPLVVLVVRLIIRWARRDAKLDEAITDIKDLAGDMKELAANGQAMNQKMDDRVRFMEEYFMRQGWGNRR
jgi:uncharacterized protein YoxC